MALLCLGFFGACSHVEDKGRVPVTDDQAQAAPAEEVITVLNPLGTPPPIKLKSMAPRLDRMEGKTIYIPYHVNYAMPVTEKQFTGHFPTGTSITVPQDMIAGIHWTNTDRHIDMDLSVMNKNGKIGWDSAYRE